ncbi:MAG: ABC transporter ATP-binding protein [Erysipelotrichaceae bacterium]|nr:ABC transporter ATP-binding protein [Erysipelotrichaceae bacterium]
MTNTLLRINGINKSFGRKQILKDLSFELHKGEIVAIVGKSGAGKSTLLNIIGLLDNNFEGNFSFLGNTIKPLIDYSSFRRENIGFVFQSYFLISKHSVIDNILMPVNYRNEKRSAYKKVVEYLTKELFISSLLNENVDNLSGGEKQRVAIARALLTNPKIIICDEPTGNLDSDNSQIVLDVLMKEAENGAGIIIVTHNVELARRCNRVLYLREGSLHEQDN